MRFNDVCRNFERKGTCWYGDNCRYMHGPNDPRGTLGGTRVRSSGTGRAAASPASANTTVPRSRDPSAWADRWRMKVPPGGFGADHHEPRAPLNVYPLGHPLIVDQHASKENITVIMHVGGCARGGVPSYCKHVLYVGGDQAEYGWRDKYKIRDPQYGNQRVSVDRETGQHYSRKHDGFCGFLQAEILESLVSRRRSSANIDRIGGMTGCPRNFRHASHSKHQLLMSKARLGQ